MGLLDRRILVTDYKTLCAELLQDLKDWKEAGWLEGCALEDEEFTSALITRVETALEEDGTDRED
jgi:hypothetical protein